MPPTKLAHLVFQTNRLKEMRDWYCSVLGGRVVYEDPRLSFVTYDDEHHRVAFVDFGPLAPRDDGSGQLMVRPTDRPGFHHVAFTFGSMGDLLDNYVQLKDRGIRPFYCVNHGPTTSMYYADPDGNQMEFQVDAYGSAGEANAFMHSDRFGVNPIGVEYDPEAWLAEIGAGAPVASFLARKADLPVSPVRGAMRG